MDDEQFVFMQQKLDDHLKEYQQHRVKDAQRWSNMIKVQELNTKSISDLTESTRDLVSVWKAADGTVKTMSALGHFVKWLSGFAIVGVAIKWLIDWVN